MRDRCPCENLGEPRSATRWNHQVFSKLAVKLAIGAVVFALQAAAHSVPAQADLPVPSGLQPGDTYHLVFNSSTFTNALSSSIDYYNSFVQAAADGAGLGASQGVTWQAIASTGSIDARANAVVGATTPVYNTRAAGMQKIANGFADLWDGTIDQLPAYDEFGSVNANDPWTGSTSAGLRATGSTLGHASGTAWCGRPTLTDNRWLTIFQPRTFALLPIYALSEELTVPDADFDSDSDVDGDDFLTWQRGNGDADGNGTSNRTDLDFWIDQYGHSPSQASPALASLNAVPEPSGGLLAVAAMVVAAARSGRRRQPSQFELR